MIREAVPADAPLLARLLREAFEEYRAWYARLGYAFLEYGTHAGYSSPTFVVLQKKL